VKGVEMAEAYGEGNEREKRQWAILDVLNKESLHSDGGTTSLFIQLGDVLL
jgi:hypothetical protein